MAEIAPSQPAWAREYAWGGRNRAQPACLGRGNTPGVAEIVPSQPAWAREYAWGDRNRAQPACSGASQLGVVEEHPDRPHRDVAAPLQLGAGRRGSPVELPSSVRLLFTSNTIEIGDDRLGVEKSSSGTVRTRCEIERVQRLVLCPSIDVDGTVGRHVLSQMVERIGRLWIVGDRVEEVERERQDVGVRSRVERRDGIEAEPFGTGEPSVLCHGGVAEADATRVCRDHRGDL